MRDVILIAGFLGVFFLGYFLMDRIDKFLSVHCKGMETENEAAEPSCVLLTDEASDEEIVSEIHRFRSRHSSVRIFLYDGASPQKVMNPGSLTR